MANSTMGLIGRKIGMTQIFRDDGEVVPVTVIQTGPCTVTRVKLAASRDRYDALQMAFGEKKAARVNKPDAGQFKKVGIEGVLAHIREIRVTAETAAKYSVGAVIGAADVFTEGQLVDVVGTSKGKGFAGVMKRWNMKGFIRSHGTHEYFRHGGSIGTRLTPGMTLAGKHMPGQMGNARTTVQNLLVAKVDAERNLVYVRGGVPGAVGSIVTLRNAVKVAL
jgi:large subunit ribosomal protein L3